MSSAVCRSVGSISARTSPVFTCCPSVTFTLVTFPELPNASDDVCCAETVPLVLTVLLIAPRSTVAVCTATAAEELPRMNCHQTAVANSSQQ